MVLYGGTARYHTYVLKLVWTKRETQCDVTLAEWFQSVSPTPYVPVPAGVEYIIVYAAVQNQYFLRSRNTSAKSWVLRPFLTMRTKYKTSYFCTRIRVNVSFSVPYDASDHRFLWHFFCTLYANWFVCDSKTNQGGPFVFDLHTNLRVQIFLVRRFPRKTVWYCSWLLPATAPANHHKNRILTSSFFCDGRFQHRCSPNQYGVALSCRHVILIIIFL